MNFIIIESLTNNQIKDLQHLYKDVMGRNRSEDDIMTMLNNCKVIGICTGESNQLIGFSRIISDYIYRAVIYDVMVDANYQGTGIGRLLMETVLEHPSIRTVERIELYTIDKASFYEKWDFKNINDRMTLMRRTNW